MTPQKTCPRCGGADQVLVLCERCGSEGRLYSGHPNDPNPRDVGECPDCNGDGRAWIDAEPVECDDLDPLIPSQPQRGEGEEITCPNCDGGLIRWTDIACCGLVQWECCGNGVAVERVETCPTCAGRGTVPEPDKEEQHE